MFRITRTTTLGELQAELEIARAEAGWSSAAADEARAEADRLRAALARAEGELSVLRTQAHLDVEDRIVLRTLLRTARRKADRPGRVTVLFRRGQLHSVHADSRTAEDAAAAEGAAPSEWVLVPSGEPLPSDADVSWRMTVLPLHTEP